ncbi:patatin-like phospholipase family protein [Collimonas silvisoli]|uniref:patatin-like phospholipase family protein n=1 Tax=Collimonas silvisoli TaxID=2825884 RepID=UPI001B8C0FE4|nr:patatin-like phospholipase family protein [Collimonas silvisoli]
MTNTTSRAATGKKGLLIGGGAPNSPLIAGALAAFLDEGIEFDVISASGAGVLMGLLYTVPQGGKPREALAHWAEMGVADSVYDIFPVNYKVFMKPSAQASTYRDALTSFPLTRPFFDAFANDCARGPWSDWTGLMLASMSPSNLRSKSLGLCANLPFVEKAIDFAAVPAMKPEFYINAYNLTQGQMKIWSKQEIGPAHVRAALSFPFIYAPTQIDGDDYIEGAALDTINFTPFVSADGMPGQHDDLETLVVLDILGDAKLIRKPRNLYDAWVRSIITPLVKIAKSELRLFELEHNTDPATGKPKRNLLKLDLMGAIPVEHWPEVLDWSKSNMKLLFDVGYKAGLSFCREHAEILGGVNEDDQALAA